jgi:preprotein translocase subunit SecD
VAQTPPSAGHPGRQLLVLGLAFVFLFGLMFFGGGTSDLSMTERMTPKLGLDLIGGTRASMQAVTADGSPPQEDQMEQARQIIESRVNALGVEEAEVVVEGDDLIVISVAGETEDALRSVGDPAELRFRKVIATTVGIAPPEPPDPEATPDPDASPSPGASPGADASPGAEASPGAGATPSPTAAPESPQPEATEDPAATDFGTVEEREREVVEIVGQEALDAALALTQPLDPTRNPEQLEQFRVFGELEAPQVAVLPTKVQFHLPTITCEQLNARPAGSVQDPDDVVVACDSRGLKYLLDSSTVLGTAVSDASAIVDTQVNEWIVNLSFNGAGQRAWTALTEEAVRNQEGIPFEAARLGADNRYQGDRPIQCDVTAVGQDLGNCLVAVVLDNDVVSAPQIRQVIGGDARIEGGFTSSEARLLATQLRYGSLPLTFEPREGQTITPTLGTEYLRAGLIAAGIGVILVLLYSFFYYRLLGVVIFGSLIISSLLIFAALVVLGRGIGFTLTLAGISGFIAAVGIAADSFVIYFERLKDEIREGRTPRSAVSRAWVRARRTIISANAVTLLAAVVLYILSAGQVRGFAFALGLATVLDLLTVFTFRHPIMTLLARTRAFLSPTVSGLGRALELDRATAAASAPRTREA